MSINWKLLSVDPFLNIFNFHRQSKLSESPKFSLMHLSIMWKINWKRRAFLLNESFNDTNNSPLSQWYLMASEALYSKIFKPTPQVKNKTFPEKVLAKSLLTIKLLLKINFSRIFHFSNTSTHFNTPTVIYTFSNNLDVKAFLHDNFTLPCDC